MTPAPDFSALLRDAIPAVEDATVALERAGVGRSRYAQEFAQVAVIGGALSTLLHALTASGYLDMLADFRREGLDAPIPYKPVGP